MSDVVVIGAGVFGAWTAHHLAAAGAHVTLVDTYGPGNSRSSSGDESRILRCGYGPDEIYSRFAQRSRELWRELDARNDGDLPLWHQCGVLWMTAGDDAYGKETLTTLRRGHYAIEVLDQAAIHSRYPHLVADDIALALLEPECGVVMARRSVHTLTAELSRAGVLVRRGYGTKPSKPGRMSALRLANGTEIGGDLFVYACGAWLPAVFPELRGRIRPTRQVVMYFGTPAGDGRFSSTHTPAWIDFGSGIYGIPDIEDRGLKVGIDTHGAPIDPDTANRMVDRESVEMAREWLRRRFPVLGDAPLVESRVCQYENTSTGDFLIDRHPDHENVWIAGGGSGHGFKHGPAVGEYLARLMTSTVTPEPRFSLSRKGTDVCRSVY